MQQDTEIEFSNPVDRERAGSGSGGHEDQVRPDTVLQGGVDTNAVVSPTSRDLLLSAIGCSLYSNVVTKTVVVLLVVHEMVVYTPRVQIGPRTPTTLFTLMDILACALYACVRTHSGWCLNKVKLVRSKTLAWQD